ncbi:lectin MOA-related protein [Pseudomonas sp. CCOS 191]|uniref:lectin MOA-related protein n=1 Tax=Pseudomonas sp. CCOS 191 TaxID=1649877 RepID=UPI00062473B2|nr:lectin MOA-related protein [Pseudomonas sp. CCOS 191]CRI56281.1 hypothetical protein CCOS191_1745 [Pseudomonas sp. CCOS 191]
MLNHPFEYYRRHAIGFPAAHIPAPSAAQAPGNGLLSPPVPFEAMKSDASYVLMDEHGRVLCVQQDAKWNWAYLGSFTDYHEQVLYFAVSSSQIDGKTELTVANRDNSWHLFADHGPWIYASTQSWPHYHRLELRFANMDPDTCQFTLLAGSDHQALGAEGGSWNYLQLTPPKQATRFTLHRYYVLGHHLADLIGQMWEKAQLNITHEAQAPYQGISSDHAMQILRDSKLAGYEYRQGSFDSDDFAFVYKAQASLDAYRTHAPIPYAVGWVEGFNETQKRGANLFMDLNGKLNIIEPDNGSIRCASDWPFTASRVLI